MERPPILGEEHIIAIGQQEFSSYSYQASNSDVPHSFMRTARFLYLDFLPELPAAEIANILFAANFEEDSQAWTAIKYAEAMSALKNFIEGVEIDPDGPMVTAREIKEAQLVVGIAALNERDDEEAFAIKSAVEEHFEDPLNVLRFAYFAQLLERRKPNLH